MSDQGIQGEIARIEPIGNLATEFGAGLPPSLQILLNEGVYNRIKQLAQLMSNAKGITPDHLIGKGEACFAVINIALDAKLNPHFVARHMYQTPGGQLGYDGALVHAMLANSGQFIGQPNFDYSGDWSKLIGKFVIKEGSRGGKFPVPTWTDKDAIGLGIIVRWQVRGEAKPRVWPGEKEPFQLVQCFPLNSPLWATDPKTQIAYLAIRRFANQAAPGILGAAAYDEAEFLDASERARDISPGTNLDQPTDQRQMQISPDIEESGWEVIDLDGVVQVFTKPERAIAAIDMLIEAAARDSLDRLDGVWGDNLETVEQLAASGFPAGQAMEKYSELREQLQQQQKSIAASGGSDTQPEADQNQVMEQDQREQKGEPQQTVTITGQTDVQVEDMGYLHPGMAAQAAAAGDATAADPTSADTSKPAQQPATAQADTAVSTAPTAAGRASSPAGTGRTAQTNASPSEPAADQRTSQAIAVHMKQGKPDYKTFLTVQVTPRMRRQMTTIDLAWFLSDNAPNIEAALRNLGTAEQREWKDALQQQWDRIGQLEGAAPSPSR